MIFFYWRFSAFGILTEGVQEVKNRGKYPAFWEKFDRFFLPENGVCEWFAVPKETGNSVDFGPKTA